MESGLTVNGKWTESGLSWRMREDKLEMLFYFIWQYWPRLGKH